ncbi:MAG TPA: polysaccharide biosynthesis C-terminal domain-containing protein [Prolixibacteraceae bacterium]|nr:polysaccharide biosynthesis C-terminal domain-containing protein [Prolixibacteraceae bacterium]HPR60678.1 polysaccharide biosynthesis C-terminal domain-containing protein [Prolixibacteraceae bacterium]
MKRKFFTNLILLLAINVLIKPFWLFGIDRTVQNVTGDQYGLYYSLLALSLTLNILLDFGITNYNNRNIARYNHLLPKHLGNIFGLKLALAIVYAAVCLTWAAIVGYNNVQIHLLIFLIVNQFLLQFILYLRSNLSALHLFTTDSLVSVLDRFFMIIICGILLFTNVTGGVFKIEWFVYVQTISYLMAATIIFLIVLRKAGKIKLTFNLRFSLVFLKKTYPYAILILLMAFYNRFDTVLIERLLPYDEGLRQVSLYAHGFRLLDAVSMFGVLFAGMLLPIFSRMIKQKQSIADMVSFAFSLIIFISLSISISSSFYQNDIMQWMQYDHAEESAPIFATLMFCFIPISTTYIFGTLLTANGSIRQLNIMAAVGMILNITLNLFFIPKFQALGAAYISLITQSITALAQVLIAVNIFKFKVPWMSVLRIAVFAVLVVALGYLSNQLLSNRFFGYILMLFASLMLAFMVKLIDLRKLFNILRDRE